MATLGGEIITNRISKFKGDLSVMSHESIVQKHIMDGDCYLLDEDKHYELKNEIATKYELNPRDILVVGSAKLGFSIAVNKRYRHFGDASDIDVAIVSPELFDKVWQLVFEFSEKPGRHGYWKNSHDFKQYLFRGWIRPDLLPPSADFPYKRDWFEFFRKLTATGYYGDYRVAAGLYRSLYFLEKYQGICTRQCKASMEIME